MFSQIILIITRSGTERIIPIKPHIQPQSESPTRIIKGDIPRSEPAHLGSTMLPKTMFIARTAAAT